VIPVANLTSVAQKGANSDITSLTTCTQITGMTTPLTIAQGGTNSTSAANARTALGLAIGTDVLAPNGNGSQLTGITSIAYTAGGTLLVSADTENYTSDPSYVKTKEIQLGIIPGALRIKFDGKTTAIGGNIRIYKNGVAVGTEQTVNQAYQTFSEDISGWTVGDLVQIYFKRGNANCYVKNFRIYVALTTSTTVITN